MSYFGKSEIKAIWFIMLKISSGKKYVLYEHEYLGQCPPYVSIRDNVMLHLPCRFGGLFDALIELSF